jgi:hypothetical protein
VRPEGLNQRPIPMTSSEVEPPTFRLVQRPRVRLMDKCKLCYAYTKDSSVFPRDPARDYPLNLSEANYFLLCVPKPLNVTLSSAHQFNHLQSQAHLSLAGSVVVVCPVEVAADVGTAAL